TIKGYNGSLRDSSGNLIGELTSFTLSITQNSEQHNSFNDEWIDTTATTKSWSVDGSGMYDPDDTYQSAIVTEVISGDSVYSIEIRPEGDTTGDDNYTGSITLGEVGIEATSEGVIGFSFSGQGSGALAKGTVS
ncbi:MAG: hypothetical protein HOC17_02040, partial [Candidatus Ruthia sp.]|nr:hypothetical protein [Candidatus Ruthturnera sp.]